MPLFIYSLSFDETFSRICYCKVYPRKAEPPGGGGGVLLGILGRGVPPSSPNPDPISDQNIQFSTPVVRPRL